MSKKLSTSLQIGRDGIKYFGKRKNYILYSTQKDCGYIEKNDIRRNEKQVSSRIIAIP